jgi:hypothetical protein
MSPTARLGKCCRGAVEVVEAIPVGEAGSLRPTRATRDTASPCRLAAQFSRPAIALENPSRMV